MNPKVESGLFLLYIAIMLVVDCIIFPLVLADRVYEYAKERRP